IVNSLGTTVLSRPTTAARSSTSRRRALERSSGLSSLLKALAMALLTTRSTPFSNLSRMPTATSSVPLARPPARSVPTIRPDRIRDPRERGRMRGDVRAAPRPAPCRGGLECLLDRANVLRRARVAERQTRWLQVPVSERAWGFKSPLAHADERTPVFGPGFFFVSSPAEGVPGCAHQG